MDWSGQVGEWGEAMGSWVKGKGLDLGIGMEGLIGGWGRGDGGARSPKKAEARNRVVKEESKRGQGLRVGFRGGLVDA